VISLFEVYAKPWPWIGLIYGSQTLGSIFVTWLFQIKWSETIAAILSLAVGTALALFFMYRPPRQGRAETLSLMLPPVIYGVFIFSLSHRSFSGIRPTVDANLFHPVEYATLGILLCWSCLPVLKKRGTFFFVSLVLSISTLYGITDEIHQSFVPGRDAAVLDLVLDMIGATLGCLIFLRAPYFSKLIAARTKRSRR
jgi:VanZ family protein